MTREELKNKIAEIDGSDTLWAYCEQMINGTESIAELETQIRGYFHGDKILADKVIFNVLVFMSNKNKDIKTAKTMTGIPLNDLIAEYELRIEALLLDYEAAKEAVRKRNGKEGNMSDAVIQEMKGLREEIRKLKTIIVREYCIGNVYYKIALPVSESDFAESILFQHFYPAVDVSLLEFVSSSNEMEDINAPGFELTEWGHKVWRIEK